MSVYVALLKGVNVGGRARVDMRELRATFEGLGCADVSTYINSGNVVFRDRRGAPALTSMLEGELGRRVAVRTRAQLDALCARIPDDWANDKEQKTDVAFLLGEPGELLWNVRRDELPPRYVHDWGADVTVRNVNTVRKLAAMMKAL